MARASPSVPDNEDQRNGRPAGMSDFERGQAIEGGQRKIGQDQVNAAVLERHHEISAALDAGDHAGDAAGFQGGVNQRGIVEIILQMEDMERGGHFGGLRFRKVRAGRGPPARYWAAVH